MFHRALTAGALVLAAAVLGVSAAQAQQQPPPLQISVEPLVVQFAIAPGASASTRVTIRNTGTEKALVIASPIDWRTTLDGNVKTERSGTEGAASINPYLRLSGTEFTLEPGETRLLSLSLTLPSTFASAARDYWGGYFVRATPAGSPTTRTFGVGANILTYETVGPASRHVKVTALRVTDAGERNVDVTARIVNDGRTFVRPQIRMMLAQSGRVVQQFEDSTPAIFGGEPRLYKRTLRDLAPGHYSLTLAIDYGGDTLIEGSTDFSVR